MLIPHPLAPVTAHFPMPLKKGKILEKSDGIRERKEEVNSKK